MPRRTLCLSGFFVWDGNKLKQQTIGYEKLIELVKMDTFTISQDVSCSIQKAIAKDEVLEIGQFRSGQVGIAGTEYVSVLLPVFKEGIRQIIGYNISPSRKYSKKLHEKKDRKQYCFRSYILYLFIIYYALFV